MTDADQPEEGQLILYQTAEGAVRVEVLYQSETFWLSQKKMAELFGVEVPTINYHLKEVYDAGELSREGTLRKFRTVQQEGRRAVSREIEFYFRIQQDRWFESDFEKEVKRIQRHNHEDTQ